MSRLNFRFKSLISVGLFLLMAFATLVLPLEAVNAAGGYEVDNYKVDINVRENASVYFNEEVDVNFLDNRHGIYRWIPLPIKWDLKDADNNKTIYSAIKVSDISVASDPYEIENKLENKVIKIGDKDKTITGKKTYKLSYLINLKEDKAKGYDLFYCNLLPYHNEATVKKSEITIVMPKKFNKDEIKLIVGSEGDKKTSKTYKDSVDYKVNGNTIIVKTTKPLYYNTGITIGIKLPDGYFVDAANDNLLVGLLYIIFVAFSIISIFLWFRFGKDNKVVTTVEFEAPEGMSPAEVGYVIDGTVDRKDVVSLLFYFAQQGYLTIRQDGKRNFTIIKNKDLPLDAKPYEFEFFSGLFALGNQVKMDDLQGTFYETYESTRTLIEGEFDTRKKRIFPGSVSWSRVVVLLLAIIGMGVLGFAMYLSFRKLSLLIKLGVTLVLLVVSLFTGMCAQDSWHSYSKKELITQNLISGGATIASMLLAFITVKGYYDNLILGALAVVMIGALYFASRFMQSRTKYGAELLGKILGFKEFIKVAEKDRLEKMLESDPEYFYNVLPYAYVLGLSKKWCKKFEGIAIEPPTWWQGSYTGSRMFDAMIFYSVFNSCTKDFGSGMNIPSSEGGSFDGSSFSGGGGFGGGGMGSW